MPFSRARLIRFFIVLVLVGGFSIFLLEDHSHSDASNDRLTRKQWTSTFKKEMKELKRQQKRELADLRASQKVRRKASEKEINLQRRDCFKTATRGSEKRACVQEARQRWKSMTQMLQEEINTRRSEHQVRLKSLEDEHRQRLSGVTP